jgi:hypothetical protein
MWGYGCALRLDRGRFGAPFGHGREPLSLWLRRIATGARVAVPPARRHGRHRGEGGGAATEPRPPGCAGAPRAADAA